jgi:hypothetical protein
VNTPADVSMHRAARESENRNRRTTSGRHHPRGRGYAPPTINEDTEGTVIPAPVVADLAVDASGVGVASISADLTVDGAGVGLLPPTRQMSLSSAPSSSWSIVNYPPDQEVPLIAEPINWEDIIQEVPRIAKVLEPVPEVPVISPFGEALIGEVLIGGPPPVLQPVEYSNGMLPPLPNCPSMTQRTGVTLNPPCVFVSQYGRRIHLYNDGRCLAGSNLVNGVRQLKALPVCLICAARFNAQNEQGQ